MKFPESSIHVFCESDIIKFIWDVLVKIIQDKEANSFFQFQILKRMFGICKDNFLTYLFLCVKYYIYVCKFQNKKTNFCRVYIIFEKQSGY